MEFSRYTTRAIIAGDWIMVPPGNGRHRGQSSDSGILVVTHMIRMAEFTVIEGNDMITDDFSRNCVSHFDRFNVVES